MEKWTWNRDPCVIDQPGQRGGTKPCANPSCRLLYSLFVSHVHDQGDESITKFTLKSDRIHLSTHTTEYRKSFG